MSQCSSTDHFRKLSEEQRREIREILEHVGELIEKSDSQALEDELERRLQDRRKLRAARNAALAVPQNQHVLSELAKR